MSKLQNIRVEYSLEATVNMGNFQNQKPGYKVSADVPDDMTPTEAKDALKTIVEGWLEAEIKEIRGE